MIKLDDTLRSRLKTDSPQHAAERLFCIVLVHCIGHDIDLMGRILTEYRLLRTFLPDPPQPDHE